MRKANDTPPIKDFDGYLADVAEPAKTSLIQLWHTIKQVAPNAEEVISYQIPTFKHQGALVGFGVAKNHCSFYTMSPPLMAFMAEELKGYNTSTGTIRFPFNEPLPVTLVKKIVKARIKENEAAAKKKKK